MNWDALYDVLAPACGIWVFVLVFITGFFVFAVTELDDESRGARVARRVAVIGWAIQALLFISLLIVAAKT